MQNAKKYKRILHHFIIFVFIAFLFYFQVLIVS